uniref:Ig-like domain-containing protein n=1 Tax=Parascaris equorum TaxID=6256 RepID=A0A914RIE6_PAREQ
MSHVEYEKGHNYFNKSHCLSVERPLNVDERFTLVKELSRETFVKVGENVIIECLFVDPAIVVSWTAVNAYGQTIRISDDSSASNTSKTAIKILNASEDVGGSYTCHGALDGDIRKFSTSLTVRG